MIVETMFNCKCVIILENACVTFLIGTDYEQSRMLIASTIIVSQKYVH